MKKSDFQLGDYIKISWINNQGQNKFQIYSVSDIDGPYVYLGPKDGNNLFAGFQIPRWDMIK